MQRRDFLGLIAGAGATLLCKGHAAAAAENAGTAGVEMPDAHPSVDMHSHAWRRRNFAADLQSGGMNVIVLVVTSDRPLLHRDGIRLRALGSVAPGALHAQAVQQADDIARIVRDSGFAAIRAPADVDAARTGGRPGAILGYEGGDVLEGSLERVGEIHAGGARLLQLVHYRVNELGDIQTENPVHGGLAPFGIDVVRRCNRRGLVVDLAHATYEGTKQAVAATTKPLVLSHTFLTDTPRRYTRGIAHEHARAVAASGGVIGVAPFPSAFPGLPDYVAGIARMVDAVGIDHVGIGTDMGGLHGAPPLNRYEQYPLLVRTLLEHGFGREDLAKVLGGNFMRVFRAVDTSTGG